MKEILATSGWCVRATPASSPKPFTILITPGGKPASFSKAPKASAVNGVCSAGFTIAVHPANNQVGRHAGKLGTYGKKTIYNCKFKIDSPAAKQVLTFCKNIINGPFHGKISPHTPTGCFNVYVKTSPSANTRMKYCLSSRYIEVNLYNFIQLGSTYVFLMKCLPNGMVSP